MDNRIKSLIGKNPSDFEPVAFDLINTPNTELFKMLIEQDSFLFDFIKQNVADRLKKACNQSNFRNLLALMKFYSPYYEEFISSTLAYFADEDLTDELLNIFEYGTEDEKIYCAKFFSYIKDPLALPMLRKNSFCENTYLAQNCAIALGQFKDQESFNTALQKLNSDDDFEQFAGVNFLISFGDKSVVKQLIKVMKRSSMSENIAGQIPYLADLTEILEYDFISAMIIFNNIINGLGEIIPLASVFDFNFWEIINSLSQSKQNSITALVLENAKRKFEILTENDEYIFDEDKNTKNEILEIKKLLSKVTIDLTLVDTELRSDSEFVNTALEISKNTDKIKNLLNSDNPTLVLKSAEALKQLNAWDEVTRQIALNHVKQENLRAVILAL